MDEGLTDAAAEAGADAIEEAVAADVLHADAVEKAEMAVALEAAAEELAAEAVMEEEGPPPGGCVGAGQPHVPSRGSRSPSEI